MIEISTSILGVKDDNSVKTFYNLETAKTDFFHIDVMDGKFVKNNTEKKMKDYSLKLYNISNIPLDVHFMCSDVKKSIEDYIDLKPDRITFHLEALKNKEEVINTIEYLKSNGIKAGIAIKPTTEVSRIYDFLPYLHMVLIMTVEPGEGGQTLIPYTIDKIKSLKNYIEEKHYDIDIEADGGINDENCEKLKEVGANILVVGSYIINSDNYQEAISKLKA